MGKRPIVENQKVQRQGQGVFANLRPGDSYGAGQGRGDRGRDCGSGDRAPRDELEQIGDDVTPHHGCPARS